MSTGLWVFAATIMTSPVQDGCASVSMAATDRMSFIFICVPAITDGDWEQSGRVSAVPCAQNLCRKVCCAQCRQLAAAAAAGDKDSTAW